MRSFVAIPIPDETADALERLQRRLGLGRAVARENLHLTLAFLDDQPDDVLETLHDELLSVRGDAFALSLQGVGQFGSTLHVAVADCAPLTALHDHIQHKVRRVGIPQPRRRFRPHITIARLRHPAQALPDDAAAFTYPDMDVASIRLYSSVLHPEGARHDCLAEYPLGARA